MEHSPSSSKPSGIPRISRLPVPRSSLRTAPSRENLQQAQKPTGIINPRLRAAPSRDQLASSTTIRPRIPSTPVRSRDSISALPRDRDASTGSLTPILQSLSRRTSYNTLYQKPSQPFFAETPGGRGDKDNDESAMEDTASNEDPEEPDLGKRSRKPRPSLSERTMETLQRIPSSPAVRRRGSSFYSTENPMRPTSSGRVTSRPGSRQQMDTSMRPPSQTSSRPTSRAGQFQNNSQHDFRASTNTYQTNPTQGIFSTHGQPGRSGVGRLVRKPSNIQSNLPQTPNAPISKLPSPIFSVSPRERSPSPAKPNMKAPTPKAGSKTLSSRTLKPRASVNGLFRKPSMSSLDQVSDIDRIGFGQKKKTATLSNTSSEATSTTSRISSVTSKTTVSNGNGDTTPRKSSSALRDQISKAKAAKRAAAAKNTTINTISQDDEVPVIASGTFDFGLPSNPFNQGENDNGAKGLLRKRIDAARTDGRLNIAGMGFKEIPDEVMNMYNLDVVGANGGSWAESVDLTRLIAADNELEVIQDDIFPDLDPRDSMNDEDGKGNQFGGLETLDLHGNMLKALPVGLRRLELLTTVNLSSNKLGNDTFDIICQLFSLRDLKMGSNDLSGLLDTRIANLKNLEVLDVQRNALTQLPDELSNLVSLRVLNVRENKLNALPFDSLHRLPLVEVLASKNRLSGALISDKVEELEHLQVLDVSCNSLLSLTGGVLRLPSLHQLDCSANRLTSLPDLTSWVSLLTIAAEDNNISSLPTGFTQLPRVRNVDLNGNNLKVLDDEIGGMASLYMFRISGNPLREKKFASMPTDDLKRALKSRMAPSTETSSTENTEKDPDLEGAFYSAPNSPLSPRPTSSDWPVIGGTTLDRSNTQSHSLNPVAAAQIASNNNIKSLELHHNKFEMIPNSIAFFASTLTSLNLAHNELTGDMFMKDDLELPALKELNLSSNTFNSLQPLFQYLKAPELERLDISFNRLTSLPILRQHFPKLINVFASHNTIRELSPEAVRGLRILDCSSNDINSLNARIGLLGGPGGLHTLNVSGNRFRVPKYTILEKGTETTLAWLRDRIPTNDTSTDVD